MKLKTHASGNQRREHDVYDFTGPLWEKYHKEVRRKARFPRGYKEVTIFE